MLDIYLYILICASTIVINYIFYKSYIAKVDNLSLYHHDNYHKIYNNIFTQKWGDMGILLELVQLIRTQYNIIINLLYNEHYDEEIKKCKNIKFYKPLDTLDNSYDCCAQSICYEPDDSKYCFTETDSNGYGFGFKQNITCIPSWNSYCTPYNKCAWVDGKLCYIFNVFRKNKITHDEDTFPFQVWLVDNKGNKIALYDEGKYILYDPDSNETFNGTCYDPETCIMTFSNGDEKLLYKDKYDNFCVKITRNIEAPKCYYEHNYENGNLEIFSTIISSDNITFKNCIMYDIINNEKVEIPRETWIYKIDEKEEWCSFLTPCCKLKEGAEGIIGYYDMTCEEFAELPKDCAFIACDTYNICCKLKCFKLPGWDLPLKEEQ